MLLQAKAAPAAVALALVAVIKEQAYRRGLEHGYERGRYREQFRSGPKGP
jgi:hypothetical protein